jgi:hypothetical protein
MSFTPTGNSGGSGVGGNAFTSSFLLQPGVYQIQIKVRAFYRDSQGLVTPGQGGVIVKTDGQILTDILLTGAETTTTFHATGSGSKLVSAGPNLALTFVIAISPNISTYVVDDCFMTLSKLQ